MGKAEVVQPKITSGNTEDHAEDHRLMLSNIRGPESVLF